MGAFSIFHLLILGAVVGGIFAVRLVRSNAVSKKDEGLSPQEKAFFAYADVLEKSDGVLTNASELPASKDEIKRALLEIHGRPESEPQRENIRGAYVMLSSFQPLDSYELLTLRRHAKAMADVLANRNVEAAAAEIAATGETYAALMERSATEAGVLLAELQAAGVRNA